MGVKPGYKQTEVGVMPEDWEVKRLGEVARLDVGFAFKSAWFRKHDGIPLLRGENVGYGRPDWSDTRRLPQSQAQSYVDYALRPGDIVIGMDRTFTKSGTKISVIQEVDCPSLLVQRVGRFVPLKCNGRFLWVLLSSTKFQESLQVEQKGMDIPHLSRLEILSPLVALPPTKAEQEAIAEVLRDVDAHIEFLEQLIIKKRQLKQGAMQELLVGKKRLPGFSGSWEVKWLGDLGDFLKGSGVNKDEAQSGNLACVRYGEIYTRHHDYIKVFYSWISRDVAAKATRLKRGDLLFAGSGETKEEIGKCVAFVDDVEAYAGGDIVILRIEKDDPLFLGYYLNTEPINRQKAAKGQGDAVVHISSSALADVLVKVPSAPEQAAIAVIISDMDAEIAALEAKLTKARQLKQGMMQELLTGRIRLV